MVGVTQQSSSGVSIGAASGSAASGSASMTAASSPVASGPASISGGTNLTFTGAGSVAVVASQAGDANWNAAASATNAFAVAKAAAAVYLGGLAQAYDGTARTVTATMLQQNPDICAVIDFWDGDASGAAAAIRDAGLQDKVALVTTGGGEQAADCDMIANGTYSAVVMTELVREGGDLVAMIKYLLQSGIAPGTTSAYIYTLEQATTKANMRPDSCWSLKALQAMNP